MAKLAKTNTANLHRGPMMKTIKGIPASQGKVRGKVRVILSPEDFSKFEAGEILVTRSTSPEWTPLLAVAKATITDTGGALCHAAIVSREYGIPAVVGTQNATQILKNGQELEVDGSKGLVRMLDN